MYLNCIHSKSNECLVRDKRKCQNLTVRGVIICIQISLQIRKKEAVPKWKYFPANAYDDIVD